MKSFFHPKKKPSFEIKTKYKRIGYMPRGQNAIYLENYKEDLIQILNIKIKNDDECHKLHERFKNKEIKLFLVFSIRRDNGSSVVFNVYSSIKYTTDSNQIIKSYGKKYPQMLGCRGNYTVTEEM